MACCSNGLVQKEWLADIFDFGNGTLEVKRLGQDNLEDLEKGQPHVPTSVGYSITNLLYVNAVTRTRENQGSSHGFGKSPGL